MKIYRVEDVNGVGFYTALWRYKEMRNHYYDFCDRNLHPTPNNSSLEPNLYHNWAIKGDDPVINWRQSDWYFGFQSKQKLINWFSHIEDRSINAVIKCGKFRIVKFEVDDLYVIEGNAQCVFKKSESCVVDSSCFGTFLMENL